MIPLRGRVALVTGASQGIGRATCLALAARGMKVMALSNEPRELAELVDLLRARGCAAEMLDVDLTSSAQVAAAVPETERLLGPLYLLVNNAGIGLHCPVVDLRDEDLRRVFEINFFSLVALTRHACRSMLERGSGHILNVSSASARRGLPWIGAYAASKAAVHAFTQALRLEMAGRGVRVSEILPISVSTSFFQRALGSGGYRPRGWVQTPEQVAERIARCAAWPRAELPGSFWTHWGLALEAAFPNTVNAVMEWLYRRQGQVGPGPGGRPEGA